MLAKTFIKKWLDIPSRGVTDVAIFHPYMLNVKQPSTLYLEGQAGNHASMKLKGDSVVKAALDSQVTRESGWTKKSSTAVTCEEMFAKCVESNQIFVPNSENTWNYESSLRHEIPKAKAAIKKVSTRTSSVPGTKKLASSQCRGSSHSYSSRRRSPSPGSPS